jgi:hypothetical protein
LRRVLPYWILFVVWAAGAIQFQRSPGRSGGGAVFVLCAVLTALMVGLRWQVGGDWGNYARIFDEVALLQFDQSLGYTDPAFGALNWAAAKLGFGVVAVNVVCGAIFLWGLAVFCGRQANPWLAMAVAAPYFIIVVGMGYTRQATAIGLVLVALSVADRRGLLVAGLLVVVGALFHKSAALALPLLASGLLRRNALFAVLGLIGSAALYALVLRGSSDALVANYVNSDYQAGGAAVRVAMNVLAGVLFFLFRKRMTFSPFEQAYWTTSALLSFAAAAALVVLPSSVAVDRMALFLIPLQIAVYARLPYALSATRAADPRVLAGVLLYSAAVLVTYLNAGTMSSLWLPYRNALLADEAAA